MTDETTEGRASFHTLVFTFPVSLFPQRQRGPRLLGSEGLQLDRAAFSPQHLPLRGGGGERVRRHPTAVFIDTLHLSRAAMNLCSDKSFSLLLSPLILNMSITTHKTWELRHRANSLPCKQRSTQQSYQKVDMWDVKELTVTSHRLPQQMEFVQLSWEMFKLNVFWATLKTH